MLSLCGTRQVGFPDMPTVIPSHVHQAGIPSVYLIGGDVYPEHSPSEPRSAQSRGHSEMQAAPQDPAQAVCPDFTLRGVSQTAALS